MARILSMHCCVLLSFASLSASMSSLNALFMAARTARRAQIADASRKSWEGEEAGPMKPRRKGSKETTAAVAEASAAEILMCIWIGEARVWGGKN